nr:hypothetical protein CFP56_54295 [Quercus suber]
MATRSSKFTSILGKIWVGGKINKRGALDKRREIVPDIWMGEDISGQEEAWTDERASSMQVMVFGWKTVV